MASSSRPARPGKLTVLHQHNNLCPPTSIHNQVASPKNSNTKVHSQHASGRPYCARINKSTSKTRACYRSRTNAYFWRRAYPSVHLPAPSNTSQMPRRAHAYSGVPFVSPIAKPVRRLSTSSGTMPTDDVKAALTEVGYILNARKAEWYALISFSSCGKTLIGEQTGQPDMHCNNVERAQTMSDGAQVRTCFATSVKALNCSICWSRPAIMPLIAPTNASSTAREGVSGAAALRAPGTLCDPFLCSSNCHSAASALLTRDHALLLMSLV